MNEPEIDFRNLPEIFSQAGKELTFTMLGLIQLGAEGTTAVLAAICSVIHYIETALGYPIRQEIERIQKEAGLRALQALSPPRLYLMEIIDGSSVEDMLERLKRYAEIVYAEPNYPKTLKKN